MPEVEIPIGPQHPALKEPVNFKVVVDGEKIVRIDLDIAYNHRGIEKAAESRDFNKSLYLVERICGICSHAHTTVFSKGVENLMNIEPPPRGRWIRTLVAELERVHSHLLWLGVAGHEIGYNTLFMYSWRDREIVQNILELVSGNRVNYGMNAIGGVRRDLTDATRAKVLEGLKVLAARADYYLEVCPKEETLIVRTKGVGRLSTDQAIELGAVGPTARGSNVPFDVRRDDPYIAYGEIPFDVITSNSCDVWGRVEVRVKELIQSVRMCIHMVENLPPGPILAKPPRTAPAGEYVSRLEAPRGELTYYLKTRGTDKADRVGVRTPTLANWPSVVAAIQGHMIADIPVVVAAIDPCLSCTSRMTFVDVGGDRSSMSWDELVEHGIRYYKEKEGL